MDLHDPEAKLLLKLCCRFHFDTFKDKLLIPNDLILFLMRLLYFQVKGMMLKCSYFAYNVQ